ncbi:TP53-regulated inhibitor of apoptosis 1-B-like [Sipha flava]|uniref:TP53-regulated inhibitor of apoptosis 1-B-like n=1 Tax=Sipha flava TaxID=143950 RepID=A0A8B8F4A3_9HEMI|nr:TP53-regulated inhibitor of apoptosis 1-B-like [Sipha flava]XP_025405620.1 TP53-regulated inhibitor of apoptosis 1-B-like [Sipha flava]XP_025405621.1 TP53-regulated inhibitor of apoptosis 1-B-like [Sipha flava]
MGDSNNSSPATATSSADRLDSFHPKCNDLKYQYDQCFNVWFTEHYMNGHYNNQECQKVFELYTECVKHGMKEYGIQYEQTSLNLEIPKDKSTFADTKQSK